jgi:hypothetical protein
MSKLPGKLPKIEINLLPKDPFMESLPGKFLTWSLSIGRYIVVLTELIVIISFLSRFQLDRKLTDLNEAIEKQKSIILSYQETENRFLTTQTKINFLKKVQQNNTFLDSMNFLEKNLPIDVKLSSISIQSSGWTLSASALSAQGMKLAVDKIISINSQSDVSMGSVKLNSRTGTIDFDINVRETQKVTQSKIVAKDNNEIQ